MTTDNYCYQLLLLDDDDDDNDEYTLVILYASIPTAPIVYCVDLCIESWTVFEEIHTHVINSVFLW